MVLSDILRPYTAFSIKHSAYLLSLKHFRKLIQFLDEIKLAYIILGISGLQETISMISITCLVLFPSKILTSLRFFQHLHHHHHHLLHRLGPPPASASQYFLSLLHIILQLHM